MTYKEAVEYLYSATPQFQQIGAAAYKPGLDTVKQLAALTGNSFGNYRVIHVAGTNGKGSTSHTLAAVLQSAGYNVGLFTSPHLLDFRERIRVNGNMVSEDEVAAWLERYIAADAGLSPSFFELTTVMAFDIFADRKVDVAVIEVGLGGRLDSTNIVTPELSIITNISKDHVAQLGNTLESIAREKAGIIKRGVPVILGEGDIAEIRRVIEEKARLDGSELIVASDVRLWTGALQDAESGEWLLKGTPFGNLRYELSGRYQLKNANTVLHALRLLKKRGWTIDDASVAEGFAHVEELTGLMGRWTVVSRAPYIVCDTGHNEGGWNYLGEMLAAKGRNLKMVVGFVTDKDVDGILKLMPRDAQYFFTRASVPRALNQDELRLKASKFGLKGESYPDVESALRAATAGGDDAVDTGDSSPMIFVGGSTFVVADLLKIIPPEGSSLSR